MKAVELLGYGDVSQLEVVERDIPRPEAGQVLIKVEAAGVVFADTLLRRQQYALKPEFPYRPGREVVGTVVELGQDVPGVEVGDRVYTFMSGGGYAEYVAADASGGKTAIGTPMGRRLFPVGKEIAAGQAVSHGVNLRVAHLAFFTRSSAQTGQSVLIHSASGGVGAHLTRFARALGMEIIALAGSDEKMAYCRDNGADHVINYREQDYVAIVKEITGGTGVHMTINNISGDTFVRDAEALRWGGELLMTGRLLGPGPIDPSTIGKGLTYKYFASYLHFGQPEDDRACAHVIEQLHNPTHLDKVVEMPLDAVRDAHEKLEAGRSFGKIILIP